MVYTLMLEKLRLKDIGERAQVKEKMKSSPHFQTKAYRLKGPYIYIF